MNGLRALIHPTHNTKISILFEIVLYVRPISLLHYTALGKFCQQLIAFAVKIGKIYGQKSGHDERKVFYG